MNCIVGKSSVFEQSKPGGSTEAHTVKIVIPENDDILRCPAASDGENVSHSASCLPERSHCNYTVGEVY